MNDANYRKLNDHSHNSSTYHKKDGTPVRAILKEELRKEIQSSDLGFPIIPVIYELDDYGEAVGCRFFCSEKCRTDSAFEYSYERGGESDSYITGTQCENCGQLVQKERTNMAHD